MSCRVVLYCIVLYCNLVYSNLVYFNVLYCIVLRCVALRCIVLHCFLSYAIISHCTVLSCCMSLQTLTLFTYTLVFKRKVCSYTSYRNTKSSGCPNLTSRSVSYYQKLKEHGLAVKKTVKNGSKALAEKRLVIANKISRFVKLPFFHLLSCHR